MGKLPFPSNDLRPPIQVMAAQSSSAPWEVVRTKHDLPNFFRVRFHDGRIQSFAYCDLREIRMINAGHLVLGLYGMEKYHIVVEGRRLGELATQIELHRVRSFTEDGPRSFERDEAEPAIDKVTVETLTGPAGY